MVERRLAVQLFDPARESLDPSQLLARNNLCHGPDLLLYRVYEGDLQAFRQDAQGNPRQPSPGADVDDRGAREKLELKEECNRAEHVTRSEEHTSELQSHS